MSTIRKQIEDLKELADASSEYGELIITRAIHTIESLYTKLQVANMEHPNNVANNISQEKKKLIEQMSRNVEQKNEYYKADWIEVPENCKDSIFEHVGIFPENYEHVLVTLEYNDGTNRMLNVKEVLYTKGNWDGKNKTRGNWTIKAWQPLPKPYKPQ